MAQLIARIYAEADKAAAAAAEARTLGYGDSEVFLVGPSEGAAKSDVAASLAQTGLAKDAAEGCADEVLKGHSVVVVHAPFGGGARATNALEKHGPIGGPPTKFATATPKSAASKTGLAEGRTLFTGELKDDAAPLSSYFKWPTLLDSPTPLSDWLKIPTLTAFTSNVQLSDEAAPLSKRMGWPVLIDDPAPLSNKMNWPVLTDDPTPLSSKMNWPVLKD